MKKPSYAMAIELREQDAALNEKFNALPEAKKWQWLIFACENTPARSLDHARNLIAEH